MPARAYLAAFGFRGRARQKPARLLSGGERNRLNLALTGKHGGDPLLLDEPADDLDVETLSALENALLGFPGRAVITAHDRWILDRLATHIRAWEGTSEEPGRWLWFEGNVDSYATNKLRRVRAEAGRPRLAAHRTFTRG